LENLCVSFFVLKGAEVDDKEEENYFVQLREERKVQDDAIARVRKIRIKLSFLISNTK